MTKREIEEIAREATSDEEQELWEKKLLGNDPRHTKPSDFHKETLNPVNTVSNKFPAVTLDKLWPLADFQEHIIQLIKNNLKTGTGK